MAFFCLGLCLIRNIRPYQEEYDRVRKKNEGGGTVVHVLALWHVTAAPPKILKVDTAVPSKTSSKSRSDKHFSNPRLLILLPQQTLPRFWNDVTIKDVRIEEKKITIRTLNSAPKR